MAFTTYWEPAELELPVSFINNIPAPYKTHGISYKIEDAYLTGIVKRLPSEANQFTDEVGKQLYLRYMTDAFHDAERETWQTFKAIHQPIPSVKLILRMHRNADFVWSWLLTNASYKMVNEALPSLHELVEDYASPAKVAREFENDRSVRAFRSIEERVFKDKIDELKNGVIPKSKQSELINALELLLRQGQVVEKRLQLVMNVWGDIKAQGVVLTNQKIREMNTAVSGPPEKGNEYNTSAKEGVVPAFLVFQSLVKNAWHAKVSKYCGFANNQQNHENDFLKQRTEDAELDAIMQVYENLGLNHLAQLDNNWPLIFKPMQVAANRLTAIRTLMFQKTSDCVTKLEIEKHRIISFNASVDQIKTELDSFQRAAFHHYKSTKLPNPSK